MRTANQPGTIRALTTLVALVEMFLAGTPALPAAGAGGPQPLERSARPVILVGRVTAVESSFGQSGPERTYWIDVEDVITGFVPSPLVARPGPPGLAIDNGASLAVGDRRHLVLAPFDDGTFEILSSRPPDAPSSDFEEPRAPGGVSVAAESPPASIDVQSAVMSTFEEQVVEVVNQERLANGALPPLKINDLLNSSSELHSSRMASLDFFAHCDLYSGSSPFDRITAAGYFWNAAAENIAAGYTTPADVMGGWMTSSGHRANILSTSYREIGVGYVLDGSDQPNIQEDLDGNCVADGSTSGPFFHYWTQNFGRRSSVYPLVIDREAYGTSSPNVALYVYGEGFALDMRFRNESHPWSAWEAYNPNKAWTLSGGDGVKVVEAEIRNGGTVLSASDTIVLANGCTVPDTSLDLSTQTITTAQTFSACQSITASNGFTIESPGNVTFRAPTVVLGSGFTVGTGASFTAVNGLP